MMFMTQRYSRIKGFTLAEVLVVVTIIGIAAMIVVPNIASSDDLTVSSAGRELVSSLLYAQSNAIATQQMCQVVFDTVNHTYALQDQNGVTIEHPVTHDPFLVDFPNNDQMSDVTITAANFDGDDTIKFNPLGIPFNEADTELAAAGVVTLNVGGESVTVNVEPVSGRILSP